LAVVVQVLGTVYDRLGSLSHVTAPEDATLMNLYWKVVPAGRLTVYDQTGLRFVYAAADRAGADEVSQLPSWAMEPEILIV
jgi:hypothetical protein